MPKPDRSVILLPIPLVTVNQIDHYSERLLKAVERTPLEASLSKELQWSWIVANAWQSNECRTKSWFLGMNRAA
jgi:hypothetical protein